MSNYRRVRMAGGVFFFTVVTNQRRKILCGDLARKYLKQIWLEVQYELPFEVIAFCLLPDHLHCIWQLPKGDDAYSKRWGLIKKRFAKAYIDNGGNAGQISQSGIFRHEQGVWQRRFWEHRIRNQSDLLNHINYIHFNPVKHRYVEKVDEWQWSTIHNFNSRNQNNNEPDWNVVRELYIDGDVD